jgi:hypothetical protein
MKQTPNLVDLTSSQLRGQLYDFTTRYATVVEDAADSIMQAADDPAMREMALLWKIEAIPEVHRAAFKPDPLLGLIDTAVLCGQMLEFYRDGAGSNLFGEYQHIVIEASAWLNRDIWRLAESLSLSGDPARARKEIAEFVAEHPIDDMYFLRDSVESLLAVMKKGRSGGAGAVIGGINEAVDDLSRRLTIYAAHLPKEARWQAELAAIEMTQNPPVEDALLAAESLAESHESFAGSVASALDLITAEREAAFGELEDLTHRTIDEINRQREDTIAALRLEREALVRAIEAQTELALQRVQEERVATMSHLEQMLETTVDYSFDRSEDLADRLFLRVLILIVILAGTLLVVAILFMRLLRQRPARRSELT